MKLKFKIPIIKKKISTRQTLFCSLLLLIVLGLQCKKVKGQNLDNDSNSVETLIKQSIDTLLNDGNINAVSVGIYKNGNTYIEHFGELDSDKENTPTDKTIYEIASVSKAFSGILVAQAVLDKKLDLEDDIRKYLKGEYPNLAYQNNPIKIKHLLTHTACLPRFLPTRINDLFNNIDENLPFRIFEIKNDYNKEAFLNDLKFITIDAIPGTLYRYSNADVELLAHILENVYEVPYEELLQNHICIKADMNYTKVHLLDNEKHRLANGYGATNNSVPHFANTLWGAGGGIKSTAEDLVKFMKYLLDDTNSVVKESQKLLYNQNDTQISYLLPVFNSDENGTFYRIHGGAYGTQNFFTIIPKYQMGISIIVNQSGPETQGKLLVALNRLEESIKKL